MAASKKTAERALSKLTDEELTALVKEAESELEARHEADEGLIQPQGRGVRIIEPESVCPWCKAPAKYIKSRSDEDGHNTGVHVFYCRVHGWYESEGGEAGGKAIPPKEV